MRDIAKVKTNFVPVIINRSEASQRDGFLRRAGFSLVLIKTRREKHDGQQSIGNASFWGVFLCHLFALWVLSQKKEPPLQKPATAVKSIVETKLDIARNTMDGMGGRERHRKILAKDLVTHVDGQRVYVNRYWYNLTVQDKEAAVYMMAVIYGMSTIHVIDGYSRARLGMFDRSMGWIQN